MVEQIQNTEGDEADILSFDDFETLFKVVVGAEAPSPRVQEFTDFFDTLGAKHFKASEFLFMGGAHHGTGSCAGKNVMPPKTLWHELETLVPVLDAVRAELGHPIRLTSIYRGPAYNTCIGGAKSSQHLLFKAADCVVKGASTKDLHKAAKDVRGRGDFKGGIGLYNSFVHIDVRGYNADW